MVVGSSGAVVELCWWGCSSWAAGPGWARSPLPQPRGPSVLRSTPAARGRGKRPPTEVAANVFGVSRGIVCLEGCWCECAAWLHAFNSVSPLKKQNIYIKKKKGLGIVQRVLAGAGHQDPAAPRKRWAGCAGSLRGHGGSLPALGLGGPWEGCLGGQGTISKPGKLPLGRTSSCARLTTSHGTATPVAIRHPDPIQPNWRS